MVWLSVMVIAVLAIQSSTIQRSKRRITLAGFAADAGEAGDGRLIFVVDVERLGVGACGLVLVAELLISKPTAGPGAQIRRIELHRLIEIGGGGFGVAAGEVTQRARDAWLGLLARQPDRGRKIVDGKGVLVLALIKQAAIVI